MLRNPDSAAAASERGGQKKLAFLSFGRWRDIPGSRTRTAANAYLQTIELAQAAEHIGFDGAFLRVHHFANLLSSPFPLLAAIGARTHRIEIGTGVVDLRHESPLHMAEAAAAVDLISGGVGLVRFGQLRDRRLPGCAAEAQPGSAALTVCGGWCWVCRSGSGIRSPSRSRTAPVSATARAPPHQIASGEVESSTPPMAGPRVTPAVKLRP